MKVLVKRDSATKTVVDCGEGPDAEAKMQGLIGEHGPENVTNEDGTPLEVKEEKVEKVESFDEMTVSELKKWLDDHNAEYTSDDRHDDLVRKAKAQARKEARAAKGDE